MPPDVYLVPDGDRWAVKDGNSGVVVVTHHSRIGAIAFARTYAHRRGVKLFVVERDGTQRLDVMKPRPR